MWPENLMSHRVANEIRIGSLTSPSQKFKQFFSEYSQLCPRLKTQLTVQGQLLLELPKDSPKSTYRGSLCLKARTQTVPLCSSVYYGSPSPNCLEEKKVSRIITQPAL